MFTLKNKNKEIKKNSNLCMCHEIKHYKIERSISEKRFFLITKLFYLLTDLISTYTPHFKLILLLIYLNCKVMFYLLLFLYYTWDLILNVNSAGLKLNDYLVSCFTHLVVIWNEINVLLVIKFLDFSIGSLYRFIQSTVCRSVEKSSQRCVE